MSIQNNLDIDDNNDQHAIQNGPTSNIINIQESKRNLFKQPTSGNILCSLKLLFFILNLILYLQL